MTGHYIIALLLQWNTLLNLISVALSSTETRIVVTAPVNPVKEHGLLSVHCQVWNLGQNHQVTLLRKLGDIVEVLSVNEDVLNAVDDRVYLAVRQLLDGSNVYFLSVTYVTRHDQGQYSCKVEQLATTVFQANEVIDVASNDISVRYFPSMSPLCTTTSSLKVHSGTVVSLNCTSEIANPPVEIEWVHAGTNEVIKTQQVKSGKVTYSVLRVTLYSTDNNRVFLCKISSPIFPDRKETCHVGPFTVPHNPEDERNKVTTESSKDVQSEIKEVSPKETETFDKEQCQKSCPVDSSKQFPWIIAFVAAVVLTILFLVIGVLLYVSYVRAHKANNMAGSLSRRSHQDDIYSELDIKPGDSKVYMPLELREKLDQDRLSVHYSDIPKM